MAGPGRPPKKIIRTVTIEDDERDLGYILKNLSPDGNWIVKIFRRENGTDNWLCTMAPEEVSEEVLAKKYGAGRYLVRPWNEVDAKWGRSKLVTISAEADGVPAETVAAAATSTGSDALQFKMIELQMKMQSEAAQRQFEMMQSFNTSMMGLMTAMIGSNKPQDLAAIVGLMKEVGNTGNQIENMRSIVSLAKDLSPGGSEDSDPLNLKSILTLGMEFMKGRAAPLALPPAPQQPPAIIPANNPPITTNQEAAPVDPRLALLHQLKEKAKSGKDAAFWADYIDENVDEPACRWIRGVVDGYPWPVVLQGLMDFDRELGSEPYVSWFEKLYGELKAEEADADKVDTKG